MENPEFVYENHLQKRVWTVHYPVIKTGQNAWSKTQISSISQCFRTMQPRLMLLTHWVTGGVSNSSDPINHGWISDEPMPCADESPWYVKAAGLMPGGWLTRTGWTEFSEDLGVQYPISKQRAYDVVHLLLLYVSILALVMYPSILWIHESHGQPSVQKVTHPHTPWWNEYVGFPLFINQPGMDIYDLDNLYIVVH
jgi:hypothetical protein